MLFWATFSGLFVLLLVGSMQIRLEEDISKIFPDDERVQKLNYIFKNSKLSEKLVMMVSVKDSASDADPDQLVAYAEILVNTIQQKLQKHLSGVDSKVDDGRILDIFQTIQTQLPIYLSERDYNRIDSLQNPEFVAKVLRSNYQQLISPSGIVTKKIIVRDPLGISFPVLKKLQHLQYDENFELYDNYILTRDHRHLLFFLKPHYPANETKNNAALQNELKEIIEASKSSFPDLAASYFGASVVAVGNAKQLQKDTILTVSIMLTLLLVALLAFFRRKRIPFLILLPVVFGALLSLSIIAVIKTSLSILALAVGAIILGVAVDYSLHFLVHLKEEQDTEKVLKQLVKPLTIGSLTTVAAFFFLRFTNASVLQDVGLFAAISLMGAALFSLIFLPHLIRPGVLPKSDNNFFQKFSSFSLENVRPVVWLILLATPVLAYYAGDVAFNNDMGKLNYMDQETRLANERLEAINKTTLSSVYAVSSGKSLEKSLRENEKALRVLANLKDRGIVRRLFSVSEFLVSDSLQEKRLQQWTAYWTTERRNNIRKNFRVEGAKLNFSPVLLANFDSLLFKNYHTVSNDTTNMLRSSFYDDYIIDRHDAVTVISVLNAEPSDRPAIYQAMESSPSTVFDKQMLTNVFVEYVHADFNYIVTATSILVFIALLLTYGRIELTLITFVPMLFTWLWILGIMALVGIEFNIVNVMVSTFIFGLGDDYSIFTMDGLLEEYRAGKKTLPAIRTSIFLSAFTTVCGLGVLIFAEHPALKSIAAISIIGIACVFVMSLVLQPYFFRILISNRTTRGLPPITLVGLLKTIYTYGIFVLGSLFLTMIGLLLKLIPVGRKRVNIFFHRLIQWFTGGLIYAAFNLKKTILNKTPNTFSRASVVIANHSSFLDILLATMQHHKLILLTNKWVWNSPVFGGVVRLADYYPVMEGAEDSVSKVSSRVNEGFSVFVFPEGTRSEDGKLRRFHKGAFYMAEHLRLPIQPLLIHGASAGIKKGDMYLNDSSITLKYLPAILPDDKSFGANYSERTKNISRYFKNEFEALRKEKETTHFFTKRLISNYIYKGPVLEWYMRVKLKLEDDYAPFHALVPMKGKILDLGCGYGFLAYMLQLTSEQRVITAVDYDEEKIETASHGFLKSDRLTFLHADVSQFPLESYDAIIISDVLHYLSSAEQDQLINRCFTALNPGGRLIIREGDRDLEKRHKGTKLTEFFSVKLLKFNKSRNDLNFISGQALKEMAMRNGLTVEVNDSSKRTSNVIFVISKNTNVHAEV